MEEQSDLPNANNPKHAAMLQRLSNRSTTKPSSSDPFESTQSFLTLFSHSKLKIDSSLSSATTKSDADQISADISALERLIAESSYFLPLFEIRNCLQTFSALKQSLDSLSSKIAPKKPFLFKKKKPVTAPNPVPETLISNSLNLEFSGKENEAKPTFSIPESAGFRDRKNEVLLKEFVESERGEFVLSDLESWEVRLRGCFRALFVPKLRNCKVYSGPVSGSVLIEEAEDCVFVLASHQIRIHNAKRCDFYLRVRSRLIIEDCWHVRFAPYCLGCEGIERDLGEVKLDEENWNWGNVDDFKWLKGFQSPNWSVLPTSERIAEGLLHIPAYVRVWVCVELDAQILLELGKAMFGLDNMRAF